MTSPPVDVSVILPFKDAAPYLRQRLEELAGQEFEGAAWEVVAVDDARTRAELARAAVQAGLLVGRLRGSVRHRVLYL